MAKAFIDDVTLTSIADAIRDVNGSSNTYLPSEMPAAISALAPDQEQLVINPSERSQTFKSTNGYANILAKPVSSTYIGSDVTRKTAASYTPTKKPQTISGGQYLTGDQTINPIPDEYIIPVLEPADVQSTDYVTRIERPPNGVDGFSQITVKGIPEEYIVPSGAMDITKNKDSIDVRNYQYVNVNVPDAEHFAYGYKTMTANASFEKTNIVDQQGNAFTPIGYAFMLAPNIGSNNTNYTNSKNSLVCCLYDTVNGRMYRNILYTPAYTIRSNPNVSSGSVGLGSFKQTASSNTVYNCMGLRYFWIAWG